MYRICYIFLLTLFINGSLSKRLNGQIYSSIEGGAPCFRRLNGTHQAGCSSSQSGAVGVVHIVQNISDAEWIVNNASVGPYMAVVNTVLFYDIIELFIREPYNVAGVLLYDDPNIRPDTFSEESKCPNEYSSGPGSKCSSAHVGGIVWNEKGTNLLKRDIPFPIFFLPQLQFDEIDKIEQCFKKYNSDLNKQKGQPLCSLQMNSFMYAAVNSEVCMRRSASSAIFTSTKVCDPLGDYNVYYSLFPRAKEDANLTNRKPVFLVTARIDSASLFDGLAPGAASSVVGMVTHVVAAAALSKMINVTDEDLYDKNVIWTLFNGEAFDYIGSQRVAYEIDQQLWPPIAPLSSKDIKLHIELGQIGGSFKLFQDSASWPLYAYAPYEKDIPGQVNEFLEEMYTYAVQGNMTVSAKFDTNLPPSSLHSFRRILSNATSSGDLPELLIVDHNETFTNKFYDSVLDDHENIGFAYHNLTIDSNGKFLSTDELLANGIMKDTEAQVKIARVATVIAKTLYHQLAGKPYTGGVAASAHLVDEMLYCFLRSQSCPLLAAADYATSTEEPPERPAPLYVGVASWSSAYAVYAGHLLALLTGYPMFIDKIACDKQEQAIIEREQSKKTLAKRAMPLYVGSAARAGAPTWRTGLLLALLTGTRSTLDRNACNNFEEPGFSHYWLRGWNHSGVCIQTTMNFSHAISPAFIEPDYDLMSGKYSTWTESVWQAMWARLFVQASGQGARLAAITGAVATILVAVITYWIRKHSEIIFVNAPVSIHSDATGIIRTVNC